MIKKRKAPAKQTKAPKPERSDTFSFSDHIKELRRRVLWVALAFVIASSLAYTYHELVTQIVMAPLKGEKLVYLTPGGGFGFIFQITMYAGLVAAGPVLMYQVYRFLRPALPEHAKKNAIKITLLASFLMAIGVGYGYFVAVPSALTFLSTFAGSEIIPNLTADSYLNFFLAYTGGLALLFQLPLLLVFWHWIKPMKPGGLLKSERYVVLLAFIAAAIITPTPDVVNQAMIAVPLIAIYQLGVISVFIAILRAKREAKKVLQTSHTATVSKPAAQTAPPPRQPTPQIAAIQPKTPSIDGFGPTPASPARVRNGHHLSVPPRPATLQPRHTSPLLTRRPPLSIDGMTQV